MRRLTNAHRATLAAVVLLVAACGSGAGTPGEGAGSTDVVGPGSSTIVASASTVGDAASAQPGPSAGPVSSAPVAASADTVGQTSAAPTSVADTAVVPALVALAAETGGEQEALAVAATDEGRAWATGDPAGGARAAGDPFLGGYEVLLDDGTTQHQLVVLDGTVVPNFGTDHGVDDISGPLTGYFVVTPPETPRQQAALDAALASLAATAPGATHGGILSYRIYFPPTEQLATLGTGYPSVAVFAVDVGAGRFASGGVEYRRAG